MESDRTCLFKQDCDPVQINATLYDYNNNEVPHGQNAPITYSWLSQDDIVKIGFCNEVGDLYDSNQEIIEDGKTKFLYNEQAYNVLKNYYSGQVIEEIKENPKMLLLAQENTILKNTLEEYKEINIKFENMYLEEKNRNESFIEYNTKLKTQNNYLLEENKKMQEELEKLKNRNFFERLFNRY